MKFRETWKVILFSLITLGIYEIYWLYATRQEMVALGQKVPRVIIQFIPVIVMVVTGFLVTYMDGALTGRVASDSAHSISNIIALVIFIPALIACLVVPLVWYYLYSRAAANVTENGLSLGSAYALWLVLSVVGFGFVWPGLVQDGFNKVAIEKPGA